MPMRHFALASLLLLAPSLQAGFDPANFDPAIKPADDFYHYADGGWLKSHPIPADHSSWGAFYELDENNHQNLHAILESAAHATRPNQIEQQVGDFYQSGMDEPAIEAAGLSPLQLEFARLAALRTPADVQAEIAHLHAIGVEVVFLFGAEQDPKESSMMIGSGAQAGLGLPDQAYYVRADEKSAQLRQKYIAHVARTLVLSGESAAQAAAEAQTVMRLETALARASKTNVELRDPVANYHRLPAAELRKLTPQFDWSAYFTGIALTHPGEIDIGQPDFFRAFDGLLLSVPVSDWRCYFRWHLVRSFSAFLPRAFVNESFDFYGQTLTGTPQLRERWKRVLGAEDAGIGEALGQLYVARYFPPASKARMLRLVANLRATFRTRLEALEWMDPPTKAKALAKLDAFGVKIGYPDKWIDYSHLVIDRQSYALNVLRARAFNVRRDLNKIGKPTDRGEWGMTPPTVNAYYDPTMNEVVFPAGILQPPFFDNSLDPAVNFGAIGAVIGHEMTHGFDDQGRQFDAHGNLADWWTPASAERFKALAARVIRQFSGYIAIDGLHVNGELTQGENIADLGGVTIAYHAFEKAQAAHPRETIGGFTPEQRFFLSWATVWRENIRPEALRLQINTDPHSPPEFRVDGPLSNLAEFADAFHIPANTPMVRPAADRVRIW